MIVDGKKIAGSIEVHLKDTIHIQGLQKSLAIFYVGNDPVIDNFIGLKKKFGERIGVRVRVFRYEAIITTKQLVQEIKDISKDFDGVIVQLPLPIHLDKKKILNSVPPDKDIDVLGDKQYKKFTKGDLTFFPPVPGAISEVLDFYGVDLMGKKITVVGNGILVGKPVADWLTLSSLKSTIVTDVTRNKKNIYERADIIISGVGAPNIITKDMVKKGVVLIDVGASAPQGVLVGDIAKNCKTKASLFSTVPGGVGPITIAILFRNLLYT